MKSGSTGTEYPKKLKFNKMVISKAEVTQKSGSPLPDQVEDKLREDDRERKNTLKKLAISAHAGI